MNERRSQSASPGQSWVVAITSGLIAGVLTSVLPLVGTSMTIDSQREQARDDYLRTERRKAYADFQGCINQIREAFFDVFEYDPYITVKTRYPERISTGIHNGAACVEKTYLQVELLAPTDITQTSWRIQNYYGLRVQAFDRLLKALSETPVDPGRVDRTRSGLDNREIPLRIGSPETESVIDVEGRLISEMRKSLGNSGSS